MTRERYSQRPPRTEPILDPRVEPGSGNVPLEEEVIFRPQRRNNGVTSSRGRIVPSEPTERRQSLPPPNSIPPQEDGEFRRRLVALHNELAENSEVISRQQILLTTERTRAEEFQERAYSAEIKLKDAIRRAEEAEIRSTSTALRISGLEQELEATRTHEQSLQEIVTTIEERILQLNQRQSELEKEKNEAINLFEETCQEANEEKKLRLAAEATLESERAGFTAERNQWLLEQAALRLEAQHEIRLEFTGLEETLRTEKTQKEAQFQEVLSGVKNDLEQARRALSDMKGSLLVEQEMRSKARATYESAMARVRTDQERILKERDEDLRQSKDRAAEAFRQLEELRKEYAELKVRCAQFEQKAQAARSGEEQQG